MSRHARTVGVLIAVLVVAAQVLLIPLFAGPAAALAPRDLPIAISGPPQLRAQIGAAYPGAFAITTVPDASAADAAIKDRSAYGAIVVTAAGAEVHVASAAGPAVSTLLTQAAAALGQSGVRPVAQPVPVRDVVPLDADDPHGAGFGAGFLPLAITSLLAGVLIFLFVHRRAARLIALGAFAALAGLAAAAVQQYWLGILPGDYFAVAGVLGLLALGVAAAVAGLAAVLGRAGLALGALVVFLVGNALSGISSAPQLLPQPWGEVGQWLPIGAGGTLLRSVAYFDGHGARSAATVLAAYAIGGLLLVVAGKQGLGRRTAPDPAEGAVEPELVPAH